MEDDETHDILSFCRQHKHSFHLIVSIVRDIVAVSSSNTLLEIQSCSCKLIFFKRKFSAGFTEASDSLFAKRKCDTMQKKNRGTDVLKKTKRFFNYCFHTTLH